MASTTPRTPILFWALIALIAWAPFPFASNRPWSWSFLALAIGVLMILWAYNAIRGWAPAPFGWRQTWPFAAPFLLALLWGWLQTASFLPEQWDHPIWQIVADQLGTPVTGRIAVDADRPDIFLMRLLAYGGVFWLAMQYGRSRANAALAFKALMVVGVAYAAYGLVAYFIEPPTILWFHKWAYHDNLTSTFVNRNNYATYAGLGLVVTIALTYDQIRRQTVDADGWRSSLASAIEAFLGRPIASMLVIALLVSAILLTESRGGFLSTVCGVSAVLLALAVAGRASRRRMTLGGVGVLVLVVIMVWVSGGRTIERLDSVTNEVELGRPFVYGLTLDAAADAPITGYGLGSFADVFQAHRPQQLRGRWREAHNSYVELVLDLGYPMAAALFLGLAIAAGYCLRGTFRRRRDNIYPAVAFAATVLVGVHALVDFSLQIPAVAVTYAFILGIGFSQSFGSNELPDPAKRVTAQRL